MVNRRASRVDSQKGKITAVPRVRCISCIPDNDCNINCDDSLEAVESEFSCNNSEQRPDTAADSQYFQHSEEL